MRSANPNVAPLSDDRGVKFDHSIRNGHTDGLNTMSSPLEEEGVEVILGGTGEPTKVMDSPDSRESRRRDEDQNVFRAASSRGRPHHRSPYPSGPQAKGSGSFGYGHPPYSHPPAPVPYQNSGSFEDGYHQQQGQYSPHVQYPQPGHYASEDVNVISPSHASQKGESPQGRPPRTPYHNRHAPPSGYYQYPPASPVSRPVGSSSSHNRHPGAEQRQREVVYQGESGNYHPDDGTWNAFPPSTDYRPQPPLVTESSFDSEPYQSSHNSSQYSSHPPTPGGYPEGPPPYDTQQQFYGAGSWGSFDSQQGVPPPQFDDQRYYSYPPPPDSPYGQYSQGAPYYGEPYPPQYSSYHGYEDDEHRMMRDYGPDSAPSAGPGPSNGRKQKPSTPVSSNTSNKGIMLPQAAYEVNFEVTNPPLEPFTPQGIHPICRSPADINRDDVLCGRGGGTNSQIGNRRFRKLVQDFQPTYLMARRKEKPRLARTIVLVIRNRGGRFLKKNEETGELFEVGDAKAEAKTSQALREGLDVRATKCAATSLTDKKKKTKNDGQEESKGDVKDDEINKMEESPPRLKDSPTKAEEPPKSGASASRDRTPSPPPQLPKLQGEGPKAGIVHPHSPDALQFRKRRRMRTGGCNPLQDKLFPDFCPPRADLCRTGSPDLDEESAMNAGETPTRRNGEGDAHTENLPQPGCADIAMMMMTGAASGSFCLGPKWNSSSR